MNGYVYLFGYSSLNMLNTDWILSVDTKKKISEMQFHYY